MKVVVDNFEGVGVDDLLSGRGEGREILRRGVIAGTRRLELYWKCFTQDLIKLPLRLGCNSEIESE